MADEALFDENLDGIVQPEQVRYDEENIRHMSDMDHIRNRPGMYIGKLGTKMYRQILIDDPNKLSKNPV